jgi:hypothetical protein
MYLISPHLTSRKTRPTSYEAPNFVIFSIILSNNSKPKNTSKNIVQGKWESDKTTTKRLRWTFFAVYEQNINIAKLTDRLYCRQLLLRSADPSGHRAKRWGEARWLTANKDWSVIFAKTAYNRPESGVWTSTVKCWIPASFNCSDNTGKCRVEITARSEFHGHRDKGRQVEKLVSKPARICSKRAYH